MARTEQASRLLTSAETCELLRIGTTKFYELVKSGELVATLLPSPTGRRREWRVEESEVRAVIQRNRNLTA